VCLGLGFGVVRVLEGRTSPERGPLQVSRLEIKVWDEGGRFSP
jgi:hypothetical protein